PDGTRTGWRLRRNPLDHYVDGSRVAGAEVRHRDGPVRRSLRLPAVLRVADVALGRRGARDGGNRSRCFVYVHGEPLTREIGVRMALGADVWNVRGLVLRDAIGAVVAGAAVGLVATFWFGRLVESMLFGISSRNPVAIASATAALLVTAVVAAY